MRLSIATRYLLTHRRQSLVCTAGVTIGVMVFLSMQAMMVGFREKFIIETVESSGHVQVNDEPREQTTPILERAYSDPNAILVVEGTKPREQVKKIKNAGALMAKLRRLPGVTAVSPEVTGGTLATYGTKTMTVSLIGIDPEQQAKVTTLGEKMIEGSMRDLHGVADGILLGRGVALVLGAKVGDSITLAASKADGTPGGRALARVVGVFQTGVVPVDYARAYMLLPNAQTLLDKKSIINRLSIRTVDYTEARSYAAQIEGICGYKVESWQETNENFLKIFKVQDAIVLVITAAILIVAAFGVLNILIMAVMERINDIAILKSFGYSRADITMIFLAQGLVIGVVGATMGLILGKLAIIGLAALPIPVEGLVRSEGLMMKEHTDQYVFAFVASVTTTLIAAVYPARRAASYDPVEVIRGAH